MLGQFTTLSVSIKTRLQAGRTDLNCRQG